MGTRRPLSLGSAFVLLAGGALALYCTQRRRRKRGDEAGSEVATFSSPPDASSSSIGALSQLAVDAKAQQILDGLFQEAAACVSSLPDSALSQSDRLLLYALYKQATVGDRDGQIPPPEKPSRFHIVAHAKYMAWGKFSGMRREVAMIKYHEGVRYLSDDGIGLANAGNSNRGEGGGAGIAPLNDDNADIVYSEEDDLRSSDEEDDDDAHGGENGKSDEGGMKGMGKRISTLAADGEDTENNHSGDSSVAKASTSRKRTLITAAMEGDLDKLRSVMASDTAIAVVADETGQTALHFAADRGFAECVSALLGGGADPNAVDGEGISVLQAAVIGDSVDCVRLLLQGGADPDHKDMDGDSPRSCANDDSSEEMKALFSGS